MAKVLYRLIISCGLFLIGLNLALADDNYQPRIIENTNFKASPKKIEKYTFNTDPSNPVKRFIVNSSAQEKFSVQFASVDGKEMKDLIICLSDEMDPLSGVIVNVKTIRFTAYLPNGLPHMEVETGILNPCFYIIKPKMGQLDIISHLQGISHLIVKQSAASKVNYLLTITPNELEKKVIPEELLNPEIVASKIEKPIEQKEVHEAVENDSSKESASENTTNDKKVQDAIETLMGDNKEVLKQIMQTIMEEKTQEEVEPQI